MATDEKLTEKLQKLPAKPGVYFHKSKSGETIYIGKAAVLKNRVRQYFQASRSRDTKTMALVNEIVDVEWIVTENEIDALFLESEMVKRYMPRYNVLLRDDKSQVFVRIPMKDQWPTVTLTRNPLGDKAEYIGPFYNGYEVKNALRYLRKVFPYFVREPSERDSQLERQIGLNPDTRLGPENYKTNLRKLMSYLRGNRVALTKEIEAAMKLAAQEQRFEDAAMLRNRLNAMKQLTQRIMFGDREAMDLSRDRALQDVAQIFGLPRAPRRIEGFDISHHGGREVVASMVVFSNGASDRGEYRKFKMTNPRNDDAGNMYEVLLRRFSERNTAKWPKPDLILVDGGKPQLAAAVRAMQEKQMSVPVISLAKREEEILLHKELSHVDVSSLIQKTPPGVEVQSSGEYVVINLHSGQRNLGGHARNLRGELTLSPFSDVTKLFQRIRDESHRFAISYHTHLARKKQTTSILDQIPGVGPQTKKKLLKKFGSVSQIRQAPYEELQAVVGGDKARILQQYLDAN